jgi:hypothetical protein
VLREVRERLGSGEGHQVNESEGAEMDEQSQASVIQHAQVDADAAGVMVAGEQVAASLRTLARPASPPQTSQERSSGRGIKISLRGLDTFPNVKRARVFYAVPHSEDRGVLQAFAEAVQKRFVEEGVVKDEKRALTLHATVANLKYAKSSGVKTGRGDRRRKGLWELDASALTEEFGAKEGRSGAEEFSWADDIVIDRVRICKMGAVKSEDPVKGMEYPAIRIEKPGDGTQEEVAEVLFT